MQHTLPGDSKGIPARQPEKIVTAGPEEQVRMKFACNDSDVLILWDVDDTLIETRGVGRATFAEAFA
ncbi:hypothetical protein GCM10027167_40780 [Nocardia heshunensis]